MPGECERLCQRSVNFRNTCSIGFYSRSIPGERRFCDTLPSKQAVAGSSPVSRSYLFNDTPTMHFSGGFPDLYYE